MYVNDSATHVKLCRRCVILEFIHKNESLFVSIEIYSDHKFGIFNELVKFITQINYLNFNLL